MFPKSNVGINIGDVCFVPREDGLHVPFICVGKRRKERAFIFGAFGNVTVATPELEQLPACVAFGEHALVHIKCYRENNTPIVGNILNRLDEGRLGEIGADIHNSGVGHVTRVWGWRSLLRTANGIAA